MTELGIGPRSCGREEEAVSQARVGADKCPGSAWAIQHWQLGVLSDIELLVSKGGVEKSEQSCLGKERVKS